MDFDCRLPLPPVPERVVIRPIQQKAPQLVWKIHTTRLFRRRSQGERDALDELMRHNYTELKRLAAGICG
jgi:hypothetical protein